MFEDSETWQRMKGEGDVAFRFHIGYVPDLESDTEGESRALRIAAVAAVVLHLVLFLVHLPEIGANPKEVGQQRDVFVVQPVRFKPPPPAQVQQIPKPQERRRKIPIPDPTPDDPEPIVIEEVTAPDIDLTYDDAVFGVPDVPAGFGRSGPAPMEVGGDVMAPVKIFYPSPRYTEEARQSQIQGVVILRAIIDEEGNVTEVDVLKGLPMGLGEAAVEAARQWKFRPATLDGRPVPVYFNLTISFSLQ